jgi:sodium-dependent phosphate cotransporter
LTSKADSLASHEAEHPENANPSFRRWIGIAALTYVILLCVATIGSGFKLAAGTHAKELFQFAQNPVLSLFVGTVATALIQSSSTVTSIIVGLVAGGMPITVAVPMIMGANIGTTITNTLVSLGHIREPEEFKRAFAGATIHDFFNLIAVFLFLPLEILTGFLEKSALQASSLFGTSGSLSIKDINFVKAVTKPVVKLLQKTLSELPDEIAGSIMVVAAVIAIVLSITILGRLLRKAMVGAAKKLLHAAIGKGAVTGIASGTAVTVLVQSSSTTTSLMIPLVGSGIFSVREIYPFTLGANIGTTITALLAATAATGDNAQFALQIAFVHLFFNLAAVLVIFGIPFLREIPVKAADWLSDKAVESKLIAATYVLATFFLLPIGMILLWE